MAGMYNLIIHENGKVLQFFKGLWDAEVDGNTVRHRYGEVKNIKKDFVLVSDAEVYEAAAGQDIDPRWLTKDEKQNIKTKEIKLEDRLKAIENRLAKIEQKLPRA
ncbi:hypothetical protein PTH_2175 [Pelotomaculum thermopropionicum SI]|uniref:Uncharacterized protein n=1 Tax=Pelotomaculum thermopropionicum (strain DSM 13744 / JCM 10971 / SI) TaxID=370438 RepID=A5D092_PELTS|nr:hypothetical protein PTH_2175 [Pelotomaculum thermopropionicum SI]